LRRSRPDRLGLQGGRRLAAGRRRQGGAEGRRHGALGVGAIRRRGRAEDAHALAFGSLLHGGGAGRQRQDDSGCRSRVARRRDAKREDAKWTRVHRTASRHARASRARRSRALERAAVTARIVAAVFATASLAGCGNGGHGTATIWVTRDRGTHVLVERTVPAGLTAMQGLDRVAHIKTRYAGRFVQAIDGVDG